MRKRKYPSLVAWRDALALTQLEAAQRFGVTKAMWSFYESGRHQPRPQRAQRISQETGVPLEIVLGLADSSKESESVDRTSQNS